MLMLEGARINGRLWLEKAERGFAGAGRIALLEAVQQHGSISAAARALGMSYKAAWEAVDAMNGLAEQPLVVRTAGGRRGGGTRLTEAGAALVGQFRALQREYAAMLARLNAPAETPETAPAPNRFAAAVTALVEDESITEVALRLTGGPCAVATLPAERARALGLAPGRPVDVAVEPSAVLLAPSDPPPTTSARNRLCGRVIRCVQGRVRAELTLELDGGLPLRASLTTESVRRLGLHEGGRACALIKAPHVRLLPYGTGAGPLAAKEKARR